MVIRAVQPKTGATIATLLAVAALGACDSTRVVQGECRDVYGADVCTWASFDGDEIQELGLTFPLAAAENVPEELQMVWPPAPIAILSLPEEAVTQTGFTHFELNWEHHGHPPAAFEEPHFDFHFYSIAEEQLDRIDCKDTTLPMRLPSGYGLPGMTDEMHGPGLCVPSMGMHAMPEVYLESPEKFTATVLVGYYGGAPIFVEPMISQAKLMQAQSFSLDVPPLEGLGLSSYPTEFNAEYDPDAEAYRISFSGFVTE